MKKKLLNILSITMFVLFSVCIFAGCDKAPTDPSSPDTPTTAAPAYTREGDYIYFGEYPQTIKADNVTVSEFADQNGYYLGSDGEKYVKQVGYDFEIFIEENYGPDISASDIGWAKFSNNTDMVAGQEYYFKVEKLKWRILKEENGKTLILCDSIIQNKIYQPNYKNGWVVDNLGNFVLDENNERIRNYSYEYSEIRKFLNNDFYAKAFGAEQKTLIELTTLENETCGETQDYVFVLNSDDYTNQDYGFSAEYQDIKRKFCPTDYARTTGGLLFTKEFFMLDGSIKENSEEYNTFAPYFGCGPLWARSKEAYGGMGGVFIGQTVDISLSINDPLGAGVVPALYINL